MLDTHAESIGGEVEEMEEVRVGCASRQSEEDECEETQAHCPTVVESAVLSVMLGNCPAAELFLHGLFVCVLERGPINERQ